MIALIESPVEDLTNEKYLSSKDNKMQIGIKEINRNCSSPCEGIVPKVRQWVTLDMLYVVCHLSSCTSIRQDLTF